MALLAAGCMADLGTLENGYSSGATGIDNHNVVVGWSDVAVQTARVAFVRHPGEGMVALGGPYAGSVAYAINDHGVIVGAAANARELRHAVMWEADGTPHDIGVDASYEPYAVAINNGGLVIGTAVNLTAAMWTAGSHQLVPLAGLGGRQTRSAERATSTSTVGAARGDEVRPRTAQNPRSVK